MWIDLSCPAEVIGTELVPEENLVRLILMDLTDRGIDSCEATVRILDRGEEETGRAVHRARALKGRPHSVFSMTVPFELTEKAFRAEARLDKVWFDDNDVWRRNPSREIEYESNALEPGNDLNALKFVAGNTAVGFPSQQAELWICVCGRPNANSEAFCGRCQRQREMIFRQFQRGEVLRQVSQRERQLELQTRGAREETAQMQRLREEEYNRKQVVRKRRKALLAFLAAALALTAAVFWGAEPGLRLWSAEKALREDRLEDARATLDSLGQFPGAPGLRRETEIRIARRDGEAAAADESAFPEERMAETVSALREKGDGEDDSNLADRVELSMARALLKAGKADRAEDIAKRLPETTEGRDTLLRDCTFFRGEQALRENRYGDARTFFLSLENDPEAALKAEEALYEDGLARMEAGEYDAAIECFTELGDYQDSPGMISKSMYLKASVLESQGKMEEARQAYLAAGNWEDAEERAQSIRWNQAEGFLEAKDYASALPIYQEMDGYEDARDKWILCATEVARTAYRQREYLMAAGYLENLPEQTREAKQILTRALYLGAKAAADRGELEEAVSLMERVSTYGDAQKNIRNWRMEIAQQRMDEGKYEEAKAVLQPVADQYQAQKLLKEIEKMLAPEE